MSVINKTGNDKYDKVQGVSRNFVYNLYKSNSKSWIFSFVILQSKHGETAIKLKEINSLLSTFCGSSKPFQKL